MSPPSSLTRPRSSSTFSVVAAALLMSGGCKGSLKPMDGSGGAGASAGAGGIGGSAGGAGAGGSSGASGGMDGNSIDGAVDATTSDKPSFCPKSIAEYCPAPDNLFCTPTWTDVLAPNSSCSSQITIAWRVTCGDYNVRRFSTGGDVTWDQYYDISTGALIAITVDSGGHCVAGPPDFAPPNCQGPTVAIERHCPDGGADASAD